MYPVGADLWIRFRSRTLACCLCILYGDELYEVLPAFGLPHKSEELELLLLLLLFNPTLVEESSKFSKKKKKNKKKLKLLSKAQITERLPIMLSLTIPLLHILLLHLPKIIGIHTQVTIAAADGRSTRIHT